MVSENYYSNSRFQPILTLYHSEFIWHGESEIASITSTAGIYDPGRHWAKLFDNDPSTIWQRSNNSVSPAELIIEFKASITFRRLILQKRSRSNNYKNVCLRTSELNYSISI